MNLSESHYNDYLTARSTMYRLFHILFGSEPQQLHLDFYASAETREVIESLKMNESTIYDHAIARFQKVAEESNADELFLKTLSEEYTRLFIGPKKLIAPPWSSMYRGDERRLLTEVTLKVREAYRLEGCLPAEYPRVADDHIAIMMNFMALLSERTAAAWSKNERREFSRLLAIQIDFLKQHLVSWIPQFACQIRHSPTDILYPSTVSFLDQYLKDDQCLLGELLLDKSQR